MCGCRGISCGAGGKRAQNLVHDSGTRRHDRQERTAAVQQQPVGVRSAADDSHRCGVAHWVCECGQVPVGGSCSVHHRAACTDRGQRFVEGGVAAHQRHCCRSIICSSAHLVDSTQHLLGRFILSVHVFLKGQRHFPQLCERQRCFSGRRGLEKSWDGLLHFVFTLDLCARIRAVSPSHFCGCLGCTGHALRFVARAFTPSRFWGGRLQRGSLDYTQAGTQLCGCLDMRVRGDGGLAGKCARHA
mmetsp:Transcript_73776/g.119747  ORF Transcript_73776/g.119747 Transcript_73776/m.119747 type:complete len:244 (+) Transcript_73776:1441-2172(+)